MNKQGKLVVISGFSGVGKGTVIKEIINTYDDCLVSISATTREPREGETHGEHYFFVGKEKFEEMIDNDKFLEHAKYVENYYGTPIDFVQEKMDKGMNVILEIEMQGALKVKEKVKDAMLLFILPPTVDTLKKRLVGRQTETEEVIKKRLLRAAEEVDFLQYYDYFVINDTIKECAEEIHSIITGESESKLSKSFIDDIKKEIIEFSKGEI